MSGPAHLVLLCGLLCDRRAWKPVAELLKDVAEYSIVSFAGCASIDTMADEVLAAAPERFALAGHSMGGRVALEVYRKAPRRVQRLALLNTGVHPVNETEVAGRHRLLDIARRGGMTAVADDWLPPMVGKRGRRDAAMMEDLREMISHHTYLRGVRRADPGVAGTSRRGERAAPRCGADAVPLQRRGSVEPGRTTRGHAPLVAGKPPRGDRGRRAHVDPGITGRRRCSVERLVDGRESPA